MAAPSKKEKAAVGVCLGTLTDPPLSGEDIVALCNMNGIQRMRLYDPDQGIPEALGKNGKDIELMLGVPNTDLKKLTNQNHADDWVKKNVVKYDPSVKFRYIAVGDGVSPWNTETEVFVESLISAMDNVYTALDKNKLADKIKVSTAIDIGLDTGVLDYGPSVGYFKPSECSFRGKPAKDDDDDDKSFIEALLKKLEGYGLNGSPLLVNIHPYRFYPQNGNNLDYAIFQSSDIVVADEPLGYTNLFDALVDGVYSALAVNHPDMKIVVSETGWPTKGGSNATKVNASLYNNSLIQHVINNIGTPKKLNWPIEAYIYAMFDETKKSGKDFEKHWGIFKPDQTRKYVIKFN